MSLEQHSFVNLQLMQLEGQSVLNLANAIIAVLQGNHDLNQDQFDYWISRASGLIEITKMDSEVGQLLLGIAADRQKKEAVNVLIPFINGSNSALN